MQFYPSLNTSKCCGKGICTGEFPSSQCLFFQASRYHNTDRWCVFVGLLTFRFWKQAASYIFGHLASFIFFLTIVTLHKTTYSSKEHQPCHIFRFKKRKNSTSSCQPLFFPLYATLPHVCNLLQFICGGVFHQLQKSL